nr:hypothetical protein GCM10020092_023050 [Actinoplanes digitatis]
MIGDLIRSHRKRLGLTQEDLAARAGVHTRTIGKIEAGQISSSRQSTARLLAEALGLVGAEREAFFQAAASTVDTSTQPAAEPAARRSAARPARLKSHSR